MQKYLVAYQNEAHPIKVEMWTDRTAPPAETAHQVSVLREAVKLDEGVRDRNRDKKAKMKGYADKKHHAEERTVIEGEKVSWNNREETSGPFHLRVSRMK